MSILIGSNSFVSVSEADEYFKSHLEAELWVDDYEEEKKEAALIGAFYRILAACTWDFQTDSAPEIVKVAQFEWALELSKQTQVTSKTATPLVSELGAGPAKIKFQHEKDDGFGGVNDWIKDMLSKECQCSFVGDKTVSSDSASYTIRS